MISSMVISSPCQSANFHPVNDFPGIDISLLMNWLLQFFSASILPITNATVWKVITFLLELLSQKCFSLTHCILYPTARIVFLFNFVPCSCYIGKGYILQHTIQHSLASSLGATFNPPVNVSSLTSVPLCTWSFFHLQQFSFQSMLIMPYPSIKLRLSYYILRELFFQPKIIFCSQQIRSQYN